MTPSVFSHEEAASQRFLVGSPRITEEPHVHVKYNRKCLESGLDHDDHILFSQSRVAA